MRPPAFLLLLMLAPYSLAADSQDFAGVWTGWQCPSGLQPQSGKCANFVLELHQKQERLCGSHMFATAGATQVDEGSAPSITGMIANGTASIIVESSGRKEPVQAKAELSIVKGKLFWKRLENPGGAYLLPQSMHLNRSRHGTLFTPTFEQQLKAVCSSMMNVPAAASSGTPPPAR